MRQTTEHALRRDGVSARQEHMTPAEVEFVCEQINKITQKVADLNRRLDVVVEARSGGRPA